MAHNKPHELPAALWRHFFPDSDIDQASGELQEMIREDPRLVAQFAIILDPNANSGDTSELTGVHSDTIEKLWTELIEHRLSYILKLASFAQASPENRIEGDSYGIRTVGYMYALEMHRGTRRSGEATVAHVLTVDEMTRQDLRAGKFSGLQLEAESLASLGHDGWEEFIEARANDDRPLDLIKSLLIANKIMTPLDVALILGQFGLEARSDEVKSAVGGLIAITKTRDHRSGGIIDENRYHSLIASHPNPAVVARKAADLAHNAYTHSSDIARDEKMRKSLALVDVSDSSPARFWPAQQTFDAELRALRRYVAWASLPNVKASLHDNQIPTPDVADRITLLEEKLAT